MKAVLSSAQEGRSWSRREVGEATRHLASFSKRDVESKERSITGDEKKGERQRRSLVFRAWEKQRVSRKVCNDYHSSERVRETAYETEHAVFSQLPLSSSTLQMNGVYVML
jgi:hypothetical protein